MQVSLYQKYLEEREDFSCVERDEGFATFKITGEECYIRDIYVLPEHRRSWAATHLADYVANVAKAKGCKTLVGTVSPAAKGSTASLKVLLAYGFRLHAAHENQIIFVKDL